MKKSILRILVSAVVFALAAGIIVTGIGLISKWTSYSQYSDGYFWAGAILMSCGLLFSLGRIGGGSTSAGGYSESFAHVGMDDRSKIWAADLTRGYNVMAFLGISGVLMFGMSALTIVIGKMG